MLTTRSHIDVGEAVLLGCALSEPAGGHRQRPGPGVDQPRHCSARVAQLAGQLQRDQQRVAAGVDLPPQLRRVSIGSVMPSGTPRIARRTGLSSGPAGRWQASGRGSLRVRLTTATSWAAGRCVPGRGGHHGLLGGWSLRRSGSRPRPRMHPIRWCRSVPFTSFRARGRDPTGGSQGRPSSSPRPACAPCRPSAQTRAGGTGAVGRAGPGHHGRQRAVALPPEHGAFALR
jgi:hypothetical protein